jgi:hypothetical protein
MPNASDIIFARLASPSLGSSSGMNVNLFTLNGAIHELFDPISPGQALDGYVDYRLLAIMNNHQDETLHGLKIYLSTETTSVSTTIEIGAVNGFFDDTVQNWPAAPANEETAPAGVVFVHATSLLSAVDLGDIPPQPTNFKLVYLKRIVTAGALSLATDVGTLTVTNQLS